MYRATQQYWSEFLVRILSSFSNQRNKKNDNILKDSWLWTQNKEGGSHKRDVLISTKGSSILASRKKDFEALAMTETGRDNQ